MATQYKGFRLPGAIEFFILLGNRNQDRRFDLERFERTDCRVELSFAAVDQQNVRKNVLFIVQSFETSRNNFVNTAKVVDSFNVLDFEAAIARFERQSVDEI